MKRKCLKLLINISTLFIAIGCFLLAFWLVESGLTFLEIELSSWLIQMFVTILGFVFAFMVGRLLVNERLMFVTMKKMLKEMSYGNFDIDTTHVAKIFRLIDDDWDDFLKQLEETSKRLKEMEELKQGFISDVSHEIRSPLTSIVGFTQLAKKEKNNEEKRLYYLDNIQQESMRLTELSDSLMQLAILEENKKISKTSFSLDKQLDYALSVFKVQLDEKKIEYQLKKKTCYYYGNEELMYQVWQNLISNAIKFSEPKGKIIIELAVEQGMFLVSIADTGKGMTEIQKNRIFERFYKADSSRTSSTGGSGLGLSIVSKIIECHGDLKIDVQTELNKGTTFLLSGPIKQGT